MARVEVVRLIDDLDGNPANETVRFAVDGKFFEIDLSAANAERLRQALAPFITAGRKIRTAGGRQVGASRPRADRGRPAEVREWARRNGYAINDRGRIPSEIFDAYRAANGGDVRRGSGTAYVSLGAA